MGVSASEKMSASEIQSKLVAAIRQIAELEDKIEACDKKSKELAGEIERRSRQIFYLERNCEQRDKEISEMKTKNFMLEAKANKEDYEAKIEEQECQLERLKSRQLKMFSLSTRARSPRLALAATRLSLCSRTSSANQHGSMWKPRQKL